MNILYALAAFGLGAAMNIQTGVNGLLRSLSGNPIFASTVNFAVGTAAVAILLLFTWKASVYELPSRKMLGGTRWWMWTGGPLGVLYVLSGVLIPPFIGYGAFFSMLVAGQLLFSTFTDHIGWLGAAVSRVDKTRALGIFLLIAGALIVQFT